ncbi:MAG: FIST C-terminal domain-containing protein [Phycisphaerales bacterium]|nr:FIST C-terminal domain-containing protein [Phycisphaerales bacterium]MCB9857212.1 FIST C-terminal domain-containing protein [Phycisphaerales bacterium]MCB9863075.1 FIST C-terminal domain-containing protein [Phycisphaerales bacterium]
MIVETSRDTKFETFAYDASAGWTTRLPAHLNSVNTLVLAFASPRFRSDTAPLNELSQAFPQSIIMGCSTAGEIMDGEVHDDSIAAVAFRFERTRIQFASAEIRSSGDSYAAGQALGGDLGEPSLKAVFVLSTGLNVNGSELARGLNDALPEGVAVTGGLAGDGSEFKETWVIDQRMPATRTVTAIGFYGDSIRIGHGSRGGFDPFGPRRIVTRAAGNVLFELDGKPALALYRQYLGDRANELPSSALLFPLSVRTKSEPQKALIRTIIAIDEDAQSMTFAGDIPLGSTAQLTRSNFDRLVTAAGESSQCARMLHDDSPPSPVLSIAVSCVGRRLILGERTEAELEAACEVMGPADRQIGFYSYGELSPFETGRCNLHNQSMTITTICEQ